VKETEALPVHTDLSELFERALRACEEARRLASDHNFIVSWGRMRPRFSARSAQMLDGED